MKFGVGAPNVGEFAHPRLLVEMAQQAEAAGWDGFFLWDHLLYRPERPGAVEPWSVIAAAAAVTTRIRLGVLVTAVPRRQPPLLAQQVATIDQLSNGRIVVGAGLGSMAEEYSGFGQDASPTQRARQLDEACPYYRRCGRPGRLDTTARSSPSTMSICCRSRCSVLIRRSGLLVAGRTRHRFAAPLDTTA